MKKVLEGKRFEFNKWYSRKSALPLDGLDLYQLSAVCCEPGYVFAAHHQWCHEISYIVSGKATFHMGGEAPAVKKNDVIITPISITHSIVAGDEEPLHFFSIGFHFNQRANGADFDELKRFFQTVTQHKSDGTQNVMMAFWRCLEECSQPSLSSQLLLTGYIQSVLVHVMRAFSQKSAASAIDLRDSCSARQTVYAVLCYIQAHLLDIQSIDDIAKTLRYHPCYLSHVFREKMGITLRQYLRQKQMEHAGVLLQYSGMTIGMVSERLGYANVSSFHRAFKRFMGVSPTAYRSAAKREGLLKASGDEA